uniref:UDP binding domain-containing protein n=1 Tax=Clavibacter michiganensis TaxID=28447 RepID=UPI00292F2897
ARIRPELRYAPSLTAAVVDADVVVLLTEWQQFRDADPEDLGALVHTRRIVDGRHALDADRYRAAGWEYRALGRPVASRTVEISVDEQDELQRSA